MGEWTVTPKHAESLLELRLTGKLEAEDMTKFLVAHNAAVDSFGDRDYKVFCDIRGLSPMSPECAELMERAKFHSSQRPNFRGSAVWVDQAVVSLQHKRTSESSGVMSTELISGDEHALREHLRTVYRTRSEAATVSHRATPRRSE